MNSQQIAAVLYQAAHFDSRIRRTMNNPQQAADTLADWTDALEHIPAARAEVHWDIADSVRGYYEQQKDNRSAQYRPIEPGDDHSPGNLAAIHSDPCHRQKSSAEGGTAAARTRAGRPSECHPADSRHGDLPGSPSHHSPEVAEAGGQG